MVRISELRGWLLDAYEGLPGEGIVLWLLGEDGERYRLRQAFPITLYTAGRSERLRALWRYLQSQAVAVKLSRTERCSLFESTPLTVLQIEVEEAAEQPRLFRAMLQRFPDLDYYDADIPLMVRLAASWDVFPLLRCRARVNEGGWVQALEPLESRWQVEAEPPPLRILNLEPEDDPFHAPPGMLIVRHGRYDFRLPLRPERPLLVSLRALLQRLDPDLILTKWGDTWLLPHLLRLSRRLKFPLPLNRDGGRLVKRRAAHTYYTYGTVVHRGQQVLLYGRWHVDALNAMMFGDYGLEGVFELARVSALPLQEAARRSPGAGITAMQMITALRRGILIPYHKQQSEGYKTSLDLILSDRGGLVYQPLIGLYENVAEVDFVSMYPSLMRRFNISPETVAGRGAEMHSARHLETLAHSQQPGLLPETLAPLLDKRISLKMRLSEMRVTDCRYRAYKARASALKWLLVVCFGYTGYKNARFGKIEAHEAITAYAREALLRAKEVAEAMGFTVLHLYVDGLWVQKPGASHVTDFQPLLEAIVTSTGLPIALDGIYRWIVFLPSRMDRRVPVANRYFGVFQNGEIKARGIEARRTDTPSFIAQTQMEVLRLLAQAPSAAELPAQLPQVVALLRKRLRELSTGRVGLEQLLVRQKVSRALGEYRAPSAVAYAVGQLEAVGKMVHLGQHVRFLYVRGEPKVMAWDLPCSLDPLNVDIHRYKRLFLRAMSTVLQPLGVDERLLAEWLSSTRGTTGLSRRLCLWGKPLDVEAVVAIRESEYKTSDGERGICCS